MRALRADEIDAALALTAGEGWAFERPEFERLLRLGTCLAAVDDADGRPAGLLTVTRYPGLAWIGNVVVAAEKRGHGIGATLVRAAVVDALAHGARTVALYSVPKAVGLYEREGFRRDGALVALNAPAAAHFGPVEGVGPFARADLADVAAFDAARVGFDRRALLAELLAAYPDHANVARRDGAVAGYAIAKPAWAGSEIGPLVAADAETARRLFDAALADLPAGPVDVALPEENAPLLAHARARGFAENFRPAVMWRGPALALDRAAIGAVGGLEKG